MDRTTMSHSVAYRNLQPRTVRNRKRVRVWNQRFGAREQRPPGFKRVSGHTG